MGIKQTIGNDDLYRTYIYIYIYDKIVGYPVPVQGGFSGCSIRPCGFMMIYGDLT